MSGQNEAAVAKELLLQMQNLQASIGGENGIAAQLKTMAGKVQGLESLNIPAAIEAFEKQKTAFEKVAGQIAATSARLHGVPGAEDDPRRKQFSIMKTMIAVKTGNWDDAKLEKNFIEDCMSKDREKDGSVTKASHVADVGARGGFFIPDFVISDVITAIYIRSALINLNGTVEGDTRVTVLNGVPSTSGSIPKVKGGCVSYWVGEEDKIAESAMDVGDVNFSLKMLACMIRITQKMRDYAAYGYEAALRNDMINSMGAKLDKTMLYGSGTDNMPRGVANVNTIKKWSAADKALVASGSSPTSAAGGELDFDGLDEMVGSIEDANFNMGPGAAFIFHPKYKRRLKRTRVQMYANQQGPLHYLIGVPRVADAQLKEVVGDFGTSTQIPITNTAGQTAGWTGSGAGAQSKFTDVFFANWNDVVLVRGAGLNIESDDGKGKGFASGHIYTKATMYADTVYRYPEAIVMCPDAQVAN